MGIREIDWHDATRAQLAEIGRAGRTWRGHRWLIDDRPVLAIGSVEPHYFAGFTGAHKTCTIGLAGRDDIERNHASALSDQAMPCRTDGNPVYEGIAAMVEQLSQVQNVAVINLVQTGPQIIAASAGGVIESLADLADIARRAFTVSIDRPADAVIAEVQGPLACSFYQSDKAIKNTETAVRDGGLIVLVSPCSEGIGQDHFVSLLDDAPTANQAMDLVNRRGYRLGDHKAVRLRRLTDPTERNVTVAVVSEGLRPDHARRLGLTLCNSVDQALSAAGIDPRTSDVYHLSDAGNTCLLVR
jgi:nickel-dependent lactate racemase